MIISEFAKYLQLHEQEIFTNKTEAINLLAPWIESVLSKNPKNNIEKMLHKEIFYCKNSSNDSVIIGKSDSGRTLVKALIEFAKSYQNYNRAKWIEINNKQYYNDRNFP